jgi:hypothetical protein
VSDATLFNFISSYRGELDFRHTASGRRFRGYVHDPGRRPHPTDGLPIGADVTEEWRRYRVAARNEDVAWFRRRPGLDHQAVVELLAATYPDLEPLTDADIYDPDEMQPSGDADVPERARP